MPSYTSRPPAAASRDAMATRYLTGQGSVVLPAGPVEVRAALLDPEALRGAIPGADAVEQVGPAQFRATISFGAGRLRGRYAAELTLSESRLGAMQLQGGSQGPLGGGTASAQVELTALAGGRTRLSWTYQGTVSGPVALLGRRLLQTGNDLFIHRFFAVLAGRLRAGGA